MCKINCSAYLKNVPHTEGYVWATFHLDLELNLSNFCSLSSVSSLVEPQILTDLIDKLIFYDCLQSQNLHVELRSFERAVFSIHHHVNHEGAYINFFLSTCPIRILPDGLECLIMVDGDLVGGVHNFVSICDFEED